MDRFGADWGAWILRGLFGVRWFTAYLAPRREVDSGSQASLRPR